MGWRDILTAVIRVPIRATLAACNWSIISLASLPLACSMPKRVFHEVGGFDEVNLMVAFNDVDLCLKIREAGYSIVWTPYAELYHLESASRGYDYADRERAERAAKEVA